MNTIEVMKQALEALEDMAEYSSTRLEVQITALRAAIAEMEKAEPVAWQVKYVTPAGVPQIDWFPHPVHPDSPLAKHGYTEEPLYTHPAPAVPEGEK